MEKYEIINYDYIIYLIILLLVTYITYVNKGISCYLDESRKTFRWKISNEIMLQ
jgi:hypothetical protein